MPSIATPAPLAGARWHDSAIESPMGTILLISVPAQIAEQLRAAAGQRLGGADAVEVEAPLALAAIEGRRNVCAMVLGAGLEEPIRLAQRARSISRELPILILADSRRAEHLRRAIEFTPLLGVGVRCLCARSGRSVANALHSLLPASQVRPDFPTRLRRVAHSAAHTTAPHDARYLDRLLDDAPVGIAAVDRHGVILAWNHVAGGMLHATERQALGAPIERFFMAGDRETLARHIERCCAVDAPPTPTVVRRTAAGGRTQFVQITGGSLKGQSGEAAALLILQDVTERREAEEALRQKARQQAAVANLGRLALTGLALSDIFEEAAGVAARTLGVECASVLELGDDGGLRLRAAYGWQADRIGQVVTSLAAGSPAAAALAADDALVIEDVREDPRCFDSLPLRERGVVSSAAVVVRAPGRPFGVLACHALQKRLFSQDEVYFLRTVANVLAASVERQRAEDSVRFHAGILAQVDDAVVAIDSERRILFWNQGAQRLYGYAFEEVAGQEVWDVLRHRWLSPTDRDEAERALTAGGTWTGEMIHGNRWGDELFVSCSATLVRDEGGDVRLAAVIRDVTGRKRAEEGQAFLTSAASFLASSLDYHTTLSSIARLAVPFLADLCTIDLLGPGGRIERVAATHACAEKEALSRRLQVEYAPTTDDPVAAVIFAGEAAMAGDLDEAALEQLARDADHLALLREIGVRGYIIAPLVARSRTLGAISFWLTEPGRRYTDHDLRLAQDVAARAALAVNNARLYQAAQDEIAERTRAERELAANQAQIQALNQHLWRAMRETHHRVKNNLQVIAAMVDMLLMDGVRPITPEEVRRLGSHINTLAMVHDLLTHEARDDGELQYLSARAMMERLLPMLQRSASPRTIRYSLDDARLSLRQGTSLALVVNELINNAIKHGTGGIGVQLDRSGAALAVVVTDDGPGFPAGFDPQRAASTGLELVDNLSQWDLGGEVRFENRREGGAQVVVTMPLPR